jgi:hypothetical protein
VSAQDHYTNFAMNLGWLLACGDNASLARLNIHEARTGVSLVNHGDRLGLVGRPALTQDT